MRIVRRVLFVVDGDTTGPKAIVDSVLSDGATANSYVLTQFPQDGMDAYYVKLVYTE